MYESWGLKLGQFETKPIPYSIPLPRNLVDLGSWVGDEISGQGTCLPCGGRPLCTPSQTERAGVGIP